jgi:hypothetical protein
MARHHSLGPGFDPGAPDRRPPGAPLLGTVLGGAAAICAVAGLLADRAAGLLTPASAAAAPYWTGQNCTILMVDIAGFGDPVRSPGDRRAIRLEMYRILRECFGRAGLRWGGCHREDRGDGALFVFPPVIPTAQVAERLTGRLADALRPYNQAADRTRRLQLRAALDVGPVITDAEGVTGDALVRTARLLDAPGLKEEMAGAAVSLGVITSQFVHDTVTGDYRRIRVQVKEADLAAWIRITA